MNLPNILTVSRIVMIPALVLVFFMPFQWAYMGSAIVFAVAAITDWLDGFLARRWDQSTPLGAFLDPVADKRRWGDAHKGIHPYPPVGQKPGLL